LHALHTASAAHTPIPTLPALLKTYTECSAPIDRPSRSLLTNHHHDHSPPVRRAQRTTDMSVEKCKRRYEIFKMHYSATMRLKQFFPFHLIDSMGTLEETQEAISLELRCGRVCVCVCVYVCAYAFVCAWVFACALSCVCVCARVRMCACVFGPVMAVE